MFGLYFDLKTRNNKIACLGRGVIRLYTDFELLVYPGTGRQICGGWFWVVVVLVVVVVVLVLLVVVVVELCSALVQSFSFRLKFWSFQ